MIARYWVAGVVTGLSCLVGCSDGDTRQGDSAQPTASTSHSVASDTATTGEPSAENEAAQSATATITEMLRVIDAAMADPAARDWEPEIRRYAGDPAALLAVMVVRDYATLGVRQEGATVVELDIATVDLANPGGPTVRIVGCYDAQSTRLIRENTGEVVPPGTPARFVWNMSVRRYDAEPGSPWLVNEWVPLTDQPC